MRIDTEIEKIIESFLDGAPNGVFPGPISRRQPDAMDGKACLT